MNLSPITSDLFIGTTPKANDYERLHDLRVELVINMRVERRPYKDPRENPMKTLWLPTFDTPLIPISLKYLLRGAKAALETIGQGGKVYTHCAHGAHRGVTMGACVLIAQGMNAHEAMELIKSARRKADPDAFYIRPRILKFSEVWKEQITFSAETQSG
jgi:protein-tyrosine phosphatase